jgi:hypothetical protein
VTAKEHRPALALLLAGLVLGGVGFLLGDPRLAALCWVLALPMALGGAITIGWGNARAEVDRLRADRD